MKPKVLLATTSRWYPTARLGMALANAGCAVDAVCPSGHPLGKTRALDKMFAFHGLMPLRSMGRAIAKSKPDMVIPGDDYATKHLHSLHQRAKQRGDQQTCALIERSLGAETSFPIEYARTAFMDAACAEGIRVPKTEVIANLDELHRAAEKMGMPLVLKANGTSGGYGVKIVHSLEEADAAFHALHAPPSILRAGKRTVIDQDTTLLMPALFRRRPVMNAQKHVAGCEATSAVACWKGAVLAALHFEVVKKRNAEGPATVVRVIENSEMASAAEKLVRRLNLSGMHGFDYMLDDATGNAYLIEMNPRATQVGYLALGAGRDIPAAIYSALSGQPVQAQPKVTDQDLIALFPQEWIRDAASPFLQTAYHDVPWEEPELVRDCADNRKKQSSWYAPRPEKQTKSSKQTSPETRAIAPVNPTTKARRAGLEA